jgi:TolB-like protein/Tfp pilus assembly protein PilF
LLEDLKHLPDGFSPNLSQAEATPTKRFSPPKKTLEDIVLSTARRHKWTFLASALTLILVVFGISQMVGTDQLDSLAILPFTYDSSDPEFMASPDREYLSDGLTESIINNLSQLANLRVIARSSVFRYKGKEPDIQTVGRELSVRAVLTGQIRQEGDLLRINVELIEIQGNRLIWGEKYERKLADVQNVEKEIARNVSQKLHLKLTGADQTQLAKTYTENGEAYEAYLKGRFHWNKRTDEGFKKGIIYFQEAIDKDPTYALAYAGLADCYTLRSDYGFLPSKEGYALAKGAVTLALKYDGSLAEAHTSLASIVAVTDWDWARAENEYRKAIELNPNYPTAHHWYAAQLLLQGRLDQALQEIKKAQQLDPLSFAINKDFAVILLYARDYEKALEQFAKTREIEPQNGAISTYIAQIYELQQKYPPAVAELEKAHAAAPEDGEITYALAQAYALSGRRDEARKFSNELSQQKNMFLFKEAAYLFSLLGEKDRAVAILQKAVEDHYLPVAEVNTDPRFDEMRKDARVVELLKSIGLSH